MYILVLPNDEGDPNYIGPFSSEDQIHLFVTRALDEPVYRINRLESPANYV